MSEFAGQSNTWWGSLKQKEKQEYIARWFNDGREARKAEVPERKYPKDGKAGTSLYREHKRAWKEGWMAQLLEELDRPANEHIERLRKGFKDAQGNT